MLLKPEKEGISRSGTPRETRHSRFVGFVGNNNQDGTTDTTETSANREKLVGQDRGIQARPVCFYLDGSKAEHLSLHRVTSRESLSIATRDMFSPNTRLVIALRARPAGCRARAFSSTAYRTSSIHGEPTRPSMRTSTPGPQTQEMVKELDNVFDTRSLKMIVDYRKSMGN